MTAPDELLLHLATETAAELSALGTRNGLIHVNERDHLQPSCVYAARTAAAVWEPRSQVSTTVPLACLAWPRVGRFDIAFLFPEQKPVAVELKCGIGRNAISACAWDVLKLSFALQTRVISAGYLIAATTAAEWGRGTRGAELFDTGGIDTRELRERFADWWKVWERDGYPAASSVPRSSTTRSICQIPFHIGDDAWELRVAAVGVETIDRVPWEPLLHAVAAQEGTRARDPARMNDPETLELLSWISREPRSYPEAIEVWQTHCPRHSLWEDAVVADLLRIVRNGSQSQVILTPLGEAALEATHDART